MNNNIIATVAGKEITEEEFNQFTQSLPPQQQSYLANPEAVAYFKEQFVALHLFAQMGKDEKINETEEFKTIMAKTEAEILSQLAMHEVLKNIEVSDKEAEAFYNENNAQFQKPETAHAKHILMASEDEINAVKASIDSGETTFEDAAKEHSTCPSGQKGGDLGEFGRGQMVKEFEDATFSAELGKIVGPVKTQFGYHLIKVENRTEPAAAPYAEVKDQIKQNLIQQKQKLAYDTKVSELKEKYC